jgi:hypothetical protein
MGERAVRKAFWAWRWREKKVAEVDEEKVRTYPIHIAVAFELALDQLAQLGELVPRVQRRRGREAELQVCAAAGLAEFGSRGGKVEHVVDELEVSVQSSVRVLDTR